MLIRQRTIISETTIVMEPGPAHNGAGAMVKNDLIVIDFCIF